VADDVEDYDSEDDDSDSSDGDDDYKGFQIIKKR
jgi:hypothetical protein